MHTINQIYVVRTLWWTKPHNASTDLPLAMTEDREIQKHVPWLFLPWQN